MKIYVSLDGNIRLSEIYKLIELKAEKETISLRECDGVFEIMRRRTSDAPSLYFGDHDCPNFCQHCGNKITTGLHFCHRSGQATVYSMPASEEG